MVGCDGRSFPSGLSWGGYDITVTDSGTGQAIRDGQWKYVYVKELGEKKNSHRLYNMEEDPREQQDLSKKTPGNT